MPFTPLSSPGLRAILRRNEVRTMMLNARLTAAAADGTERAEEAQRQVYQTMYRHAVGQMTAEERDHLLAILRPCCPDGFFAPTISDDPTTPWNSMPRDNTPASIPPAA